MQFQALLTMFFVSPSIRLSKGMSCRLPGVSLNMLCHSNLSKCPAFLAMQDISLIP